MPGNRVQAQYLRSAPIQGTIIIATSMMKMSITSNTSKGRQHLMLRTSRKIDAGFSVYNLPIPTKMRNQPTPPAVRRFPSATTVSATVTF